MRKHLTIRKVACAAAAVLIGALVGCGTGSDTTGTRANPSSATPNAPVTPSHPITPPPGGHQVTIGGAVLTLPAGWVVKPVVSPGAGRLIMPTWCLLPHDGPAPSSADQAACAIAVSVVPTGNQTPAMSVDTPGGLVSNPQFCGPGGISRNYPLGYADSALGTRPADYRRWPFVCKDGTRWSVEQYVADNAPGYVLYSAHATPAVHAVLAQVAKTAKLPAIAAPLRLSDFGILRSVQPHAGGYGITIDRVVQGIGGLINNNLRTYAYTVPAAAIPGGHVPPVGSLVQLTTNGTVVTSLQEQYQAG